MHISWAAVVVMLAALAPTSLASATSAALISKNVPLVNPPLNDDNTAVRQQEAIVQT